MLSPKIQNVSDVTDEQAVYLAGLAQTLSSQDDFAIQNFADSAVASPDAQSALQAESAMQIVNDGQPQGAAFDAFNPGGLSEPFALSSFQQESIFPDIWNKIKSVFAGLRRKVNHIFCEVANGLGDDQDLDLKKIIKDVLIVLIPALAGSAGLLPVALPIVVSLGAFLIKYGVKKVCPF